MYHDMIWRSYLGRSSGGSKSVGKVFEKMILAELDK